MGLFDLPEKIFMWPLNKIDEFINWVKRRADKYQYKKKTEMMYFGLFWKYQWTRAGLGKREQVAIPYCPKKSCRIQLVISNDKFFCPECKRLYVPKDQDKEIPINQAQLRATHIFKSKENLR